jgi:hypothetical protein
MGSAGELEGIVLGPARPGLGASAIGSAGAATLELIAGAAKSGAGA